MTRASDALRVLERHLDAVEGWLETSVEDTLPMPVGDPAPDLGELSPHEHERATALSARIDRCVERMARLRDDVSQELDSFGHRRSVARQYLAHEHRR